MNIKQLYSFWALAPGKAPNPEAGHSGTSLARPHRRDSVMKSLFALAFASFFALPACVSDRFSTDEIESTEAALDNDPFDQDLFRCAMVDTPGQYGPLINGTTSTDGAPGKEFSCCGDALCIDREHCDDDYGEYVEVCLDCDFFGCLLGDDAEPAGGSGGGLGGLHLPPVYNPPGGGVYAP